MFVQLIKPNFNDNRCNILVEETYKMRLQPEKRKGKLPTIMLFPKK